MVEHGFILQERTAAGIDKPEQRFAGLDTLAARLGRITADELAQGARIRWRRENQPGVWLDVEPGGYALAMTWRCDYCNTQVRSDSASPHFALESLDRYAPHGHDGQRVTIEMAKQLVREAYAVIAETPGQTWVTLTAIFNQLGKDYGRDHGGRNNPRRTAEIAIVLMGEHDPDVALNSVSYEPKPDRHLQVHSGGWADAVLIGPHLPKPPPSEDDED